MIDRKTLKSAVTAVVKTNSRECSVCVENIDSGLTAYSKLHGARVSWDKSGMTLFVPREITFRIPYMEILEIQSLTYTGIKHVEILLTGRNLLSIRELQQEGAMITDLEDGAPNTAKDILGKFYTGREA